MISRPFSTQSCPSLVLHLHTTTAINLSLPDEPSPFGAPEITWCRSPVGMTLVQFGTSDERDRVLLTISGSWQPLRDPWRAVAAVLEEAEVEYESLRAPEPWALIVQPQDAALGLALREECGLGSEFGHRYGAADIDHLRKALRLAPSDTPMRHEAINLLRGKPHTPIAQVRAGEIVAAWDSHQAADILALAKSGFAFWRRIAARTGQDLRDRDRTTLRSAALSRECPRTAQSVSPWYELEHA